MIASIQPYYVAVLFLGMLDHHHNFDGFSCISHRINYGLYEYLLNVIVVLISPVFLGLPYSRSMGYHLTLLQEGWGKGDGLGEGMGGGGGESVAWHSKDGCKRNKFLHELNKKNLIM